MPLKQAKHMIHTINNKLTAALGFIDLAGDNDAKRSEYLDKANRELREAGLLVTQLMQLLDAVTKDAVEAAHAAALAAQKSADELKKATRAADEMAEKTKHIAEQLSEKVTPITKKKK